MEENRLAEAALNFVGVACKGLELSDWLSRSGHSAASGDLLETSVSLLTVLLSKERGSRAKLTGDSLFYTNAAASMKKFDIVQSLVVRVNVSSKLAVGDPSKVHAQATPVLLADENQVRIVQSIFSFIRTVAEIGQTSDDMLSLLSSAGLFKMIVDNPLLVAANGHWVSKLYGEGQGNDQQSASLRGYLPLNGRMRVDVPEENTRTIVSGTFLSGRDDPVHLAWRTALKILQAIVHAYSQPRELVYSSSGNFLDTAIAFLKTYYISLTACLKQCSSLSVDGQRGIMPGTSSASHVSHTVLTFNALSETADILALISSLCSGIHMHMFENACNDIYHGMTRACHTVIDGLSKFLAAAGTAKEIFVALKDYDSELQQESGNRDHDFRFAFNEAQIEMNPLLSAGIPNAKHEAIKHAHYANRCCAYVTSEDYKGLPSAPVTPADSPFSTSSLEKDSQLSMNSPFMFRMEEAAAECVSTAIMVLSETHPASSCFVVFSSDEVRRRDMLSLLCEGMIISAFSEPNSSGVRRFSRILHVDTVRRLCHVRYLDEEGEEAQGTLPIDRVNGVEDISKRRPVLAYSAAPSSFAEFEAASTMTESTASLGDVIVALRWCYQCTPGFVDSNKRRSIRKALAESASALLCTEISLHEEIGTFSMANGDELSNRVLAQLLQLFDDSNEAPRWSGRLKEIIGSSVWDAIQEQLREELQLAREDRREKKMESLKRAAAINGSSPWYNTRRQHSEAQELHLNFATR